MTSEVSKQQTNNAANLASYALMPAITIAGSSGIALKNHGKNVFKSQKKAQFGNLASALKNQGVDVFTRSQALGMSYDGYRKIALDSAKATKKYNKVAKRTTLPVKTKVRNFFAKYIHDPIFKKKPWGEITLKDMQDAAEKVKTTKATALEEADKILNAVTKTDLDAKELDKAFKLSGTSTDALQNAVKNSAGTGLKASVKGFGKSLKTNFVNELGWKNGWFNYIMTGLQFIPNVINEVIPTFKEEGFVEGMKATGKTLARAAADLVGYAAGSSVGRIIGSVAGMLIPFIPKGVGARIGGTIGDMLGSMIIGGTITKQVDKIVGVKDETQEIDNITPAQTNMPNENTQIAQNTLQEENLETSQNVPVETEEIENNPTQEDNIQPINQTKAVSEMTNQELNERFMNMPSREQIKNAAYAQAFKGKGGQFNRYYA